MQIVLLLLLETTPATPFMPCTLLLVVLVWPIKMFCLVSPFAHKHSWPGDENRSKVRERERAIPEAPEEEGGGRSVQSRTCECTFKLSRDVRSFSAQPVLRRRHKQIETKTTLLARSLALIVVDRTAAIVFSSSNVEVEIIWKFCSRRTNK